MKITNTNEPLRPDQVTTGKGARVSTAKNNGEAVSESTRVQLSDLGSKLAQLETQFAGSDFDAKKVDEIRTAISEGRFKVNAEAVADKLLSSVSDLLGKK